MARREFGVCPMTYNFSTYLAMAFSLALKCRKSPPSEASFIPNGKTVNFADRYEDTRVLVMPLSRTGCLDSLSHSTKIRPDAGNWHRMILV
jgi:hypothetical protein